MQTSTLRAGTAVVAATMIVVGSAMIAKSVVYFYRKRKVRKEKINSMCEGMCNKPVPSAE